jgi:hypothetical protein
LPPLAFSKSGRVEKALGKETVKALETELLKGVQAAKQGFVPHFWLVLYDQSNKTATLCDSCGKLFETLPEHVQRFVVYVDPSNGYPSAFAKNFLGAVALTLPRVHMDKLQLSFVSIRDKIPKEADHVELKDSLYFELVVGKLDKVEWDTWILKDPTRLAEWTIDLKQVMDRKVYPMSPLILTVSPKTPSTSISNS